MTADTTLATERDFYRNLLALSDRDNPQQIIDEALKLLVTLIGAGEALLELWSDEPGRTFRWTTSAGCDDARTAALLAVVSRGIVAEAVATGEVIVTSSAHLDPRFRELESVRDGSIEAVICGPIGDPVRGHVYLSNFDPTVCATPQRATEHVKAFTRSLTAVADRAMRAAIEAAPQEASPRGNDPFAHVVARSAAMRTTVEELRFVAPREFTLLLTGPTGTGKSLLAAAVHAASARAGRPFIDVNCAAIPENLVESDLFGSEKGAHSAAATSGVPGKIDFAEKGTLFLDEIAELPLRAQGALLQVLQSRTYNRVGGPPRRADVRIIAATHVDLPNAVAEKRFREDLYYRLNVLEVRVPPLRERTSDIVPLALELLGDLCRKEGWPSLRLTPRALRMIAGSEWPGNVRELSNALTRGGMNCVRRGSDRIDANDLLRVDRPTNEDPETFHEATLAFQRRLVSAALEAEKWHVSNAARRLDVARSHLYELIRAYGLRRREEAS